MKTNRLRSPRALRIRRITLSIGLALFMFGLVCIRPAHKAEAVASFCVSDNITHDNITFTGRRIHLHQMQHRLHPVGHGHVFHAERCGDGD